MRVILILLLTAVLGEGTLGAQGFRRNATEQDSIPLSIAEAEAEGARYPRLPGRGPFQSFVDTSAIAGSSERKCLNVDSVSIGRSGEFVSGTFVQVRERWRDNGWKTWWQPEHIPRQGETIAFKLRAVRLDSPQYAVVFDTRPYTVPEQLTQSPFIPVRFSLPAAGRWMIIATVGANWGCFVTTVRQDHSPLLTTSALQPFQ